MDNSDIKKEVISDDIEAIRLCLLKLSQVTERKGLPFSAYMIKTAAGSLQNPQNFEGDTAEALALLEA